MFLVTILIVNIVHRVRTLRLQSLNRLFPNWLREYLCSLSTRPKLQFDVSIIGKFEVRKRDRTFKLHSLQMKI